MNAAAVAFTAWSLALQDPPFAGFWWYSQTTAGFAALLISGGLGAIAPFFQRPLAPTTPGAEDAPSPEPGHS